MPRSSCQCQLGKATSKLSGLAPGTRHSYRGSDPGRIQASCHMPGLTLMGQACAAASPLVVINALDVLLSAAWTACCRRQAVAPPPRCPPEDGLGEPAASCASWWWV